MKRPHKKRRKPHVPQTPLARPNVTPPPRGPRNRTWIRGALVISPITGVVTVGGELLARAFAEFDGKRVKVTLEVLP